MVGQAHNVHVAITGTPQEIIAPSAGSRVHVLGMQLVTSGALTLTLLEEGTGIRLWGPATLGANAILNLTPAEIGYFETTTKNRGVRALITANAIGGGVQWAYKT